MGRVAKSMQVIFVVIFRFGHYLETDVELDCK